MIDPYVKISDYFWPPYNELLLLKGIALRHLEDSIQIRLDSSMSKKVVFFSHTVLKESFLLFKDNRNTEDYLNGEHKIKALSPSFFYS